MSDFLDGESINAIHANLLKALAPTESTRLVIERVLNLGQFLTQHAWFTLIEITDYQSWIDELNAIFRSPHESPAELEESTNRLSSLSSSLVVNGYFPISDSPLSTPPTNWNQLQDLLNTQFPSISIPNSLSTAWVRFASEIVEILKLISDRSWIIHLHDLNMTVSAA